MGARSAVALTREEVPMQHDCKVGVGECPSYEEACEA
jgi:hypothetical protein